MGGWFTTLRSAPSIFCHTRKSGLEVNLRRQNGETGRCSTEKLSYRVSPAVIGRPASKLMREARLRKTVDSVDTTDGRKGGLKTRQALAPLRDGILVSGSVGLRPSLECALIGLRA